MEENTAVTEQVKIYSSNNLKPNYVKSFFSGMIKLAWNVAFISIFLLLTSGFLVIVFLRITDAKIEDIISLNYKKPIKTNRNTTSKKMIQKRNHELDNFKGNSIYKDYALKNNISPVIILDTLIKDEK